MVHRITVTVIILGAVITTATTGLIGATGTTTVIAITVVAITGIGAIEPALAFAHLARVP